MFSFDVFTEIMIVGGLLLLAMTPLFVQLSSRVEEESGLVPVGDYLKEGTGRLVIVLLVTYAVGVAGNRLIDEGLDLIFHHRLKDTYEADYTKWRGEQLNLNPDQPKELKVAEFLLRERNEATARWLDRHKSYIRILRGAMAACVIFIVTMTSYRLANPPTLRYKPVHFVAISVLLVIFSLALYLEAKAYNDQVLALVKGLPALRSCLKT